ncbi:MAG: hypothetical protein ACSLFB_02310 [Acidimicrobiales bacterium]
MRYGEFTLEDKQRMVKRKINLLARFVQFKSIRIPAALRQYIQMDEVKLQVAIGAYWNDLNRLKEMHDIHDKLHRSKISAYTIKWLLHFSPVYSTFSNLEVQRLDGKSQDIVHNVNYLFVVQLLFFMMDELDPKDFQVGGHYENVLHDLLYYMATGAYQEKMAALLFDALVIGSKK